MKRGFLALLLLLATAMVVAGAPSRLRVLMAEKKIQDQGSPPAPIPGSPPPPTPNHGSDRSPPPAVPSSPPPPSSYPHPPILPSSSSSPPPLPSSSTPPISPPPPFLPSFSPPPPVPSSSSPPPPSSSPPPPLLPSSSPPTPPSKEPPAEIHSPATSPPPGSKDGDCGASVTRCFGVLDICFKPLEESKEQTHLVVVNNGDNDLLVSVIFPQTVTLKNHAVSLQLTKHQLKMFSLTTAPGVDLEVIFNHANKNCTVRSLVSKNWWQLPAFTSSAPIYGSYAIFLVVVLAGGIWIWCKFGNKDKKANGGARYQHLEMGIPSQPNEAVDGWDQNWGDWDEPETKPITIRRVAS